MNQKPNPIVFAGSSLMRPKTDLEAADLIEKIVCAFFEVSPLDFHSKRRNREFIKARQVFYLLVKKYTNLSLLRIGKIVNKDHATILHGIKTCNNLMETERKYFNQVTNCDSEYSRHLRENFVCDDVTPQQIGYYYPKKMKALLQANYG